MSISLCSLVTACLQSGLLILILDLAFTVCRHHRWIVFRAAPVLVLAAILRLCIPVKPNGIPVLQLPRIMNPLVETLQREPLAALTMAEVLGWIWLAGSAIRTVIYLRRRQAAEAAAASIRRSSRTSSTRQLLQDAAVDDIPVYISERVCSPRIFGRDPSILLPALPFTGSQIRSILRHEMQHLKSHDFLKKQLLEGLLIIYWWFPPVYRLRSQLTFCFELLADSLATRELCELERMEYARALLDMQDTAVRSQASFSNLFSTGQARQLSWRIEAVCCQSFRQRSSRTILFSAFLLCLAASFITIEPKFEPPAAIVPVSGMAGASADNDGWNFSDGHVWKTRMAAGLEYRRLWDEGRGCWETNWMPVIP